jgi:hypothetical protein
MVSVSEPSERVNFPAPVPAMVLAPFIPELPPEIIDFSDRIPALVMDTFVPEPTQRLDCPLALVLAAFIIRWSDRLNSPVPIPALVLAPITVLIVDTFVPEPTERLDSPLALVLAVSCIPESILSTLEMAITLEPTVNCSSIGLKGNSPFKDFHLS